MAAVSVVFGCGMGIERGLRDRGRAELSGASPRISGLDRVARANIAATSYLEHRQYALGSVERPTRHCPLVLARVLLRFTMLQDRPDEW